MLRPLADFRLAGFWLAAATSLVCSGTAFAVTCPVPGSHATLQEALDDPSCTRIELAAQSYPEDVQISRSVDLIGPATGGAVLEGSVQVGGSGTLVNLSDLEIASGCPWGTLSVSGGAQLTSSGVDVERSQGLPCPSLLFADGFESGDAGSWSFSSP